MKNQSIEENLKSLGLTLPEVAPAAANYVPYKISGQHVYIAGQLPFLGGEKGFIGTVGVDISFDEAKVAARNCGLNIVAQLRAAIGGDWDRLVQCVKVGGFVNAPQGFGDHPAIINGCSDLLVDILEEKGRHARFAVGASSLPFNVAVEIDAIFEIK